MSIPDPTIDPITGLPILDTSGVVQQIPLGNQVTPYTDWNATAQPTRGPLYPDDIIPTFANVSGQHPTSSNAQSIQSDGNHALKVSVVNPSTGGGLVPRNEHFTGQSDMVNNGSGTNSQVLCNVSAPTVINGITGYQLHIDANPPNVASDGVWYIYIYAKDINGNPIGVERPIYRRRATPFTNVDYPWRTTYHVDIQFAQPWDVNAMWPNWHQILLEATIQAFPAYATGYFFYY